MNNNILNFVNYFASIDPTKLNDYTTVETVLLKAGLNNEHIKEQPPELSQYFGTGYELKIWQYPNQFVPYMLFLFKYKDKIDSYLEIGSRHGGTFIFTNEYLRAIKQTPIRSVACDLIEISQNILEYQNINSQSQYLQSNSQSDLFGKFIKDQQFSLILIDGDHLYDGVKSDAERCIDHGNIIVFHDITSLSCPGTTQYWLEFKDKYQSIFNFYEFTQQYDSVPDDYLGIGCAVRKTIDYA